MWEKANNARHWWPCYFWRTIFGQHFSSSFNVAWPSSSNFSATLTNLTPSTFCGSIFVNNKKKKTSNRFFYIPTHNWNIFKHCCHCSCNKQRNETAEIDQLKINCGQSQAPWNFSPDYKAVAGAIWWWFATLTSWHWDQRCGGGQGGRVGLAVWYKTKFSNQNFGYQDW